MVFNSFQQLHQWLKRIWKEKCFNEVSNILIHWGIYWLFSDVECLDVHSVSLSCVQKTLSPNCLKHFYLRNRWKWLIFHIIKFYGRSVFITIAKRFLQLVCKTSVHVFYVPSALWLHSSSPYQTHFCIVFLRKCFTC